MLDFDAAECDSLVKDLVEIAPFPFVEVSELRDKYTFNVTPLAQGIAVAKRGLKILYSDDEDDDDDEDDEGKMAAVNTSFGFMFNKSSPSRRVSDKDKLNVDITALKQQYSKLRQRQKQAQIILSTAWTKQQNRQGQNQASQQIGQTKTAMNHLLLGKKPLVASKPRRGPPPGAIPPKQGATITKGPSSVTTSVLKPTHVSRPQPEVVAQSATTTPPGKASPPSSTSTASSKRNQRSSSTEVNNVHDDEDVTENATDIEDIPRDDQPILNDSEAKAESEEEERKKRTYFDLDEDCSEHFVERRLPGSAANSARASQIIKENEEILGKISSSSRQRTLSTEGAQTN